jgi:hypothetical protein
MKSVIKSGIGLLLLLFLTNISAQNNDTAKVKKEGMVPSSRTVRLSAVNRDTTAKINSFIVKGGRQNLHLNNVIVADRGNNPRINELNKEINQLVAKYKSITIKADSKAGKVKFSGLSEEKRERVRREADAYYLRTRNQAFIHGDKDSKWKLIERYYNENYREKTPQVRRGSDPKREQYEEIRRKLGILFDLREEEKRDEIRKLEKQVSDLERKLRERKNSKREIINGRLRELLGEPNNLKW